MLKIVYLICCGIDVHKKFIIACIAATNGKGVTSYRSSRFSTFTNGLRELSSWLIANSCTDVCMKSTGKYWVPIFNILEKTCKVVLAHPKYVKAIKGKKTDKKDARWLADLFKHDLVVSSFMPPLEIRQLRDLMRYRFKLINLRSSEKARTQNSLTVSNIQISNVVSDTFGKSSMKIIEHLLADPTDTTFDVTPLVHGSMLKKVPELQLAIEGLITPKQAFKLNIIKKHYDNINECKENLETFIIAFTEPYKKQLELILTVPGIKDFSAIAIIAEIGVDMTVFPTAKHLEIRNRYLSI